MNDNRKPRLSAEEMACMMAVMVPRPSQVERMWLRGHPQAITSKERELLNSVFGGTSYKTCLIDEVQEMDRETEQAPAISPVICS